MANSGKWRAKHLKAIRTTARYLGIDEDIILNEFIQKKSMRNKSMRNKSIQNDFKQKAVGEDSVLAVNNRSAQATIFNDGIIESKPPIASL